MSEKKNKEILDSIMQTNYRRHTKDALVADMLKER